MTSGRVGWMVACAALLALGCGDVGKSKAAAEQGVRRFHASYNAEQLDEIWNRAHLQFRTITPEERFREILRAMQRKLGKVKSTSNVGWNVHVRNFRTMVTLTQATRFEHGEGLETFVFAFENDEPRLFGYDIQSYELITK